MQNTSPSSFLGPRRPALANWGRMAGAVGLVLLGSCPLTWLLTAEVGALIGGKVIVGVLLIAFYLLTNRGFFARMAGSRSTGLLVLSGLSSALVIVLIGAMNYAAYTHPWEKDLTREGLYTLAEQTRGVLEGLQTDVQIYAFYASYEQAYPLVADALARYQAVGPHLHVAMIDPQSRPDLVERYHITDRGVRLVVCNAHQEARAKDISEQEIINAVIQVAERTNKKIYLLTGHGELDPTDSEATEAGKNFVDAIVAEGYETAPLDLRQGSTALDTKPSVHAKVDDTPPSAHDGLHVPKDAAVIVALGPIHALLQPEVAALETYLAEGGRLMVLLEPHLKTGFEPLLRQWHIELADDLIVDPSPLNRLLGLGAAAPMVQPVHGDHPIVQKLESAMVMSTARSLTVTPGGLSGVEATPLAHTSETAWGETHVGKNGTAQKDDRDYLPPLFVAIAAQRPIEAEPGETNRSSQSRLLVFGDADWVNNRYLSMQGNRDFALNGISWLAEQENKITIRPKSRAASQLFLSGHQMNQVKFLSMDIIPVLIVAAGLGLTLVRRQR